MKSTPFGVATILLFALMGTGVATAADEQVTPNLIPWPKTLQLHTGTFTIADGISIAGNRDLQPSCEVLVGELKAGFGVNAKIAGAVAGSISLRIDPALKGEQYTLDTTDRVTISGGNYQAVAMGVSTLLQLAAKADGKINLPDVQIKDEPTEGFRGVMIDAAREENSIADLKRCVVMCQIYKIRYLQLHLSDNQAWTVPSKAFPKLGSANGGLNNSIVKVYDRDELVGLVKFADDRGVTIIPELDVPGHTDALRIPYPEIFDSNDGPAHMGLVDMTNPKAYSGMEKLIGESCEIFKSSPYFHIGCDEANLSRCAVSPTYTAFMAEHKFKDPYQLYCHFIAALDKIVQHNGKRAIVWGDFNPDPSAKPAIPKDVISMAWRDETDINSFLQNGYSVVNAVWTPLYVVGQTTQSLENVNEDARNKHRPETIYNWNIDLFNTTTVQPTELILGGQICAWEEGGPVQVDALKSRISAMGERLWNPNAGKSFEDFSRRYTSTNELLERLLPASTGQ